MRVTFQGQLQELTQIKPKEAGKSRDPVDGFYSNEKGEMFFIKKPGDKNELFAELFAGLLIKEFVLRKLIDPDYASSMIVADSAQFEDGSYGLIQPMVHFEELHKLINTSNPRGKDRDPAIELFFGSAYYKTLVEKQQHFGLSMALMFSLLLGAYSVHSGNIVSMHATDSNTLQFGRIDWGDALRYYAHPKNNSDILYAYANRGFFNFNKYYKDYILYYQSIPGLYKAIANKALALTSMLKSDTLQDIVLSALQAVPDNMITAEEKRQFALYIEIPAFENVQLGMGAVDRCEFVEKMAKVMNERLVKIMQLQDPSVSNSEETRYKSSYVPSATLLVNIPNVSFSVLLENWHHSIINSKPGSIINTKPIDLNELVVVFNEYINALAHQSEQMNLWQQSKNNHNIFTRHATDKTGQSEHGHAFIPYYKEATVFRNLFCLDPATIGTRRFAPFEKPNASYIKENPNSVWTTMLNLANAGQDVVSMVKTMQKLDPKTDSEIIQSTIDNLRRALVQFIIYKTAVEKLMGPVTQTQATQSYFYDIEDAELAAMTGDQLLTLCLEELNLPQASLLIDKILANDMLWQRMEVSINSDAFNGRKDNFKQKTVTLRKLRETIVDQTLSKCDSRSDTSEDSTSSNDKSQFWFFKNKGSDRKDASSAPDHKLN